MNLYVGNITAEVTEHHLIKLFAEFGNVLGAKIIKDSETGLPKGFGFVEMEDKYGALDAIDNLDQTYFLGQIITVNEAKQKNSDRGRHTGRGGNFGGNRNRSFSGGGNRQGGGNRNFENRQSGHRNVYDNE